MPSLGDYAQTLTALTVAFNCYQSWRNGRHAKKIVEEIKSVKSDVAIIEVATNSMKDALIASTAKASLAEGTAAGLEQGRKEQR